MDCTNNTGLPAVRYGFRMWPYAEDEVMEETFIPSFGLAYNPAKGIFKTEQPRSKGPFQNITLPAEIAEKVKRVAELELSLIQEKELLASSMESFFNNKETEVVDFQPIGYTVSRQTLEGHKIIPILKSGESDKQIIDLVNPIQYDDRWLVVRKVERTADNVLQIECGALIADIDALYDSDSPSNNVSTVQSIAIDKNIQFSSCKIVPLTTGNLFVFGMDAVLKELIERYEQEVAKIYEVESKSYQMLKIEELRSQIEDRLALVSDKIRGPHLVK